LETKICKWCHQEQSKEAFFNNKLTKDWKTAKCKECCRIAKQEYRTTYKWSEGRRLERSRERAKAYNVIIEDIGIKAIEKLLMKQSFECAECWKDLSDRNKRHLNHIKPLAKWWIHWIDNLQWLCIKCNLEKWDIYNKENEDLAL